VSYRIRNWVQFQHYKDRNPHWVKLYRTLLDDRNWHALKGDDAKALVLLWLLAAEDETRQGLLPDVETIAFRLRIDVSAARATITRLAHYVEQVASNLLADCYQPASLEKETETEEETEKNKSASDDAPPARRRSVQADRPEDVSPATWEGFVAIRKARRAPLTVGALDGIRAEAAKANVTLEAALLEAASRGWQSFRSDWVQSQPSAGGKAPIKFSKPASHMPNMPLGTAACACSECIAYRNKRGVM